MLRDKSLRKVYLCGRRVGKTEVMIVEALHHIFTQRNFRHLFVAPYENQIRLTFDRAKELIFNSPLLKEHVVRSISSPYRIELDNNSMLLGFTTGANTGNGGASLRGQRADWVSMDEQDYMNDADFDNVTALAAERPNIGITCSSTPTGRRSRFWQICTDPKLGYSRHYHPSTHNPNWGETMEAEFRSQLSETGYQHEIMAEFGTEDAGVFNKLYVDMATQFDNYAYNELTALQRNKCERENFFPKLLISMPGKAYTPNTFRTLGVDWDKYGASSSLLILDYDKDFDKFRVLKTVTFPKTEYSYDKAVDLIVKLNAEYNPSWIYVDRGSGEYQIERLHIIGDEHPETGLKVKVKGWQFKQNISIVDPITKISEKKPMKPFMVNQLAQAFERGRIMLSPYDENIHKQLIDYRIERISASGLPVYNSNNEHFVDALGLAYLAFVLEFTQLTKAIQKPVNSFRMASSGVNLGAGKAAIRDLAAMEATIKNPWGSAKLPTDYYDPRELKGDKQQWIQVPMKSGHKSNSLSWGSRTGRGSGNYRKTW